MADEYFQRYVAVEHAQLYRELMAGAPAQVDSLVDTWHTAAETLRATAANLRTDLATLRDSWAGESSNAFQSRAALVAAWAEELADEAVAMQTGMSAMSAALTHAQGHGGPAPDRTTAWDHDGVLGPLLGHTVTEAELVQSQEQLARVVAELAVAYEMTDHSQWSTPWPAASPDLPGTAVASDVALGADPAPAPTGTELAGTVGSAASALAPSHLIVPSAPATTVSAPLPVAAVANVNTLQGAGTSLASAGNAGLHTDQAGVSADPGSATSATLPPPVMGGGGFAPASGSDPGVISRPMYDETSWSGGEDDAWRQGTDTAPPPVLGQPNKPG
jgi:uncharacterized protein YukE